MGAWEDMLEELRALGGTADNIRLGQGPLGRGIFPVDPSKPVAIRIPENLLIDTAGAIFDKGRFRVAPSAAGVRERAFLEAYENAFSWGGGGRAETELVFALAQALPPDLRTDLVTKHRCGAWFDEPTETRVQEQFIGSRCITYRDRTVIMPIVELVNHGPGARYDPSDGLKLDGSFAGEVLVKYSDIDTYGMFLAWGFVSEQPQALSIGLSGAIGQTRLAVARDLSEAKGFDRVWIPKLATGPEGARLSFLTIGNRQYPRLCKGVFYKTMREAGLAGYEETYDTIQHVNRTHFLSLLAALEPGQGPMVRSLRRMARLQLESMSHSYGMRVV